MQCFLLQSGSVGQKDAVPVILLVLAVEFLEFLCNLHLPRVLVKPEMVHRDICDRTIGITVIPVVAAEDLLMRAVRGSVIIRILCRQSGIRMTGFMQVGPACFGSAFPELTILLIGIFRKKLVKMRQMIRWITEIQSRDKFDQFVGRFPHRIARMSRFSLMHTLMQNRFCLPAVIKNALSVSPSS